ncbi:MAG: 2-oxo acid dehydrogenase subunit E2 [Candidatus Cardinium sp.]|nr:2-oxo acid dehydrogenase subunit E2 [Candidatus Cardinium sp.]
MAELIRMPKMSDTMQQGVISRWLKQVGDKVEVGDILAEVETDKAVMELESYEEGVLLHIGVTAQSAVEVNALIAIIGEPGEDFQSLLHDTTASTLPPMPAPDGLPSEGLEPVTVAAQVNEKQTAKDRIFASPLAKRLAKEKGCVLANIPGSGEGGRIIKQDVLDFIVDQEAIATSTKSTSLWHEQESYQDRPLTALRQKMATVLTAHKAAAPHFYVTIQLQMHKMVALRPELNAHADTKISINDLMIKAVALALRQHPTLNAAWLTDKIRYYQHVHMGVAVTVEEGIMVPVIRFADQKPVVAISKEMKHLSIKAKENKMIWQESSGATFTLSNLGMFGIESFTAIINPPAACILAVGAIQQSPVVQDQQVVVAPIMKITLSCDHRVVDGAAAALFLSTLKELVEEPLRLLL